MTIVARVAHSVLGALIAFSLLFASTGCEEKQEETESESSASSGEEASGGAEAEAETPSDERSEQREADETTAESDQGDPAGEESAPEAGADDSATAPDAVDPHDPRHKAGAMVPGEHVLPGPRERKKASDAERAARAIRHTTNYLRKHVAEKGLPEDQAAAEAGLAETAGWEWPKDPWGTPYVYERVGDDGFEVSSAGPDKKKGNEDDVRVTD